MGSDNYQYKILLTIYYKNIAPVDRSTKFESGYVKLDNQYEEVDDYGATIIVREGIMIRDMVTVSGS